MSVGVILLAVAVLSAVSIVMAGMANELLQGMLWKKRVLLAFAPTHRDERLDRQREAFMRGVGDMAGRRLELVEAVGDGPVSIGGRRGGPTAESLRARFGIGSADFAAVLLGRGGEARFISPVPVDMAEVLAVIDATPERRRELARQAG